MDYRPDLVVTTSLNADPAVPPLIARNTSRYESALDPVEISTPGSSDREVISPRRRN